MISVDLAITQLRFVAMINVVVIIVIVLNAIKIVCVMVVISSYPGQVKHVAVDSLVTLLDIIVVTGHLMVPQLLVIQHVMLVVGLPRHLQPSVVLAVVLIRIVPKLVVVLNVIQILKLVSSQLLHLPQDLNVILLVSETVIVLVMLLKMVVISVTHLPIPVHHQ